MVIDPLVVAEALGGLTLMKFFPADEAARTALLQIVCEMIHTNEQAEWLVRRMIQCFREWPGPYEMRACFCGRYKPKDGISAYSEIYPDGFPIDPTAPPRVGIAATELKALPPGHKATADPEFEAKVVEAAEKLKMPDAAPVNTRFARMLREVVTAPQDRPLPPPPVNTAFKGITPEDIEKAVLELHEKRDKAANIT